MGIARQVEAGDSTRNQAQEEETAEGTLVAPYRGPEAATRVYSQRVQEQSAAFESSSSARLPQSEQVLVEQDLDDDMPPLVAEDQDDDDMISPMAVERDSDDASDGFLGTLTKEMSVAIAKRCESVYDMFLIHGAAPAEAQENVSELFSSPRVTEHLRFMPHV